jgi:glycosyltransferase involved in cell wall biosynthesis
MHVVHIMASRAHGGAETYFADLLLSLQRAGRELDLHQSAIVSERYLRLQELIEQGISVFPAPLSFPIAPLQRFRIGQLVRGIAPKVDLIHSWMRRGSELVPSGLDCPIISWSGGYYPVKKLKQRCTYFVGITPDILRHFRQGGIAADRTSLQTTFPLLDKVSTSVARDTLATPPNVPLLLTLARLHPKKGLDTLLRAMAGLPGYWLWLAGDGPLESELKSIAGTLRIDDRVRFLGWRKDRAALLSAADMLVVPSRFEPFGTVLLEGWAMQLPVVATAWPGTIISHEKTGLLVPIDDVVSLSAAIQRAWEDKALRQRLIAAAHAEYTANWSSEVSAKRMLKLYSDLCAGRRLAAA